MTLTAEARDVEILSAWQARHVRSLPLLTNPTSTKRSSSSRESSEKERKKEKSVALKGKEPAGT